MKKKHESVVFFAKYEYSRNVTFESFYQFLEYFSIRVAMIYQTIEKLRISWVKIPNSRNIQKVHNFKF